MFNIKQLSTIAALLLLAAGAYADNGAKPWALRDHYSFTGEHSVFRFDVQTAEWMVDVNNFGPLVNGAHAEIEFADGRVLRLSDLKAVRDERDNFSGPLGDGTRFRSVFETGDGLEIEFSIARFKNRPFLIVQMSMTNRSKQPIAIKEVRPAVFEPGAVANLDDAVVVTRAHTQRRGNFSVVHGDPSANLVVFEMPRPRMTLGIGLLPSGLMNSRIDLKPAGKSWVGSVRCAYEPSLNILPGAKVGCDPVWMSLFVPDAHDVHQYHAWAELTGMQSARADILPTGWVTIGPDEPVDALYEAAEAWADHYIHHALVPAGWEAQPGSLDGRKPDYPRDMSTVAREIIRRGMTPGITVDPLMADDGKDDWVVASSDGAKWLDLSQAKARKHAAKRIQKLTSWGYQFFVVAPSAIPDEVLEKFNVTRAQADLFALQLVTEAADGLPVLPSPSMSLRDELDVWERAAGSTAVLQAYGVVAGPLRLNAQDVHDVSPALAAAIGNYNGPVEIVGMPKKKIRKAVGSACCSHQFPAQASASTASGAASR